MWHCSMHDESWRNSIYASGTFLLSHTTSACCINVYLSPPCAILYEKSRDMMQSKSKLQKAHCIIHHLKLMLKKVP